MLCHLERGIAAGETSGALHHDKSVQGIRLQAVFRHEPSADGRLEGRKREVAVRIPLDDELDGGRTEMAHAIEENNCVVGLHASAPPPSHMDALADLCGTSYPTAGSLCSSFRRHPSGRVAICI